MRLSSSARISSALASASVAALCGIVKVVRVDVRVCKHLPLPSKQKLPILLKHGASLGPWLGMGISFGSLLYYDAENASIFIPRSPPWLGWDVNLATTGGQLLLLSTAAGAAALCYAAWRESELPGGAVDSRFLCWYGYNNPLDARLFVPKSIPSLGWTLNFGHPWVPALLGGALCATTLVIGATLGSGAFEGGQRLRPYNAWA